VVQQFPEEILQAGAEASMELIAEIREGSDELTKRVTESFIAALNVTRQKTDGTDSLFLRAREQYINFD
jgi:TRAP-type mannitol/chloroaromatic compound transport system substrate-binding protein